MDQIITYNNNICLSAAHTSVANATTNIITCEKIIWQLFLNKYCILHFNKQICTTLKLATLSMLISKKKLS